MHSFNETKEKLKLAVCELTSTEDRQANLEQIQKCIELAIDSDLICFPENSVYMRIREGSVIPGVSEDDSWVTDLKAWAAKNKKYIHLGSVPQKDKNGIHNCSWMIAPDGSLDSSYRKIHLFDVDVEGQKPIRESAEFIAGERPHIYNVYGWQIGASICYDLRFSELFLWYSHVGVDAILIPAAFLKKTGQAHWEILIRARAIETQCFVAAAGQGGQHLHADGSMRETFGHSMVVDPWGRVLAERKSDGESRVIFAELNKSEIGKVRSQIPMRFHRRLLPGEAFK